MKNAITLIACAGLTAVASAQDFSITMDGPAGTGLSSSSTFTIDVFGDASVGTHLMGGGFLVDAFTTGFEILDMSWTAAAWSQFNTDDGHAGGGNYNQVIVGQLVIPGVPPFDIPAIGSEIGGLLGSFQIQVGQLTGAWSIDLELIATDPFALEVIDINTGTSFQSSSGNLTLTGFHAAVPAPSAFALLGFGGLVAIRRRR